jgi:hypothetical protein
MATPVKIRSQNEFPKAKRESETAGIIVDELAADADRTSHRMRDSSLARLLI